MRRSNQVSVPLASRRDDRYNVCVTPMNACRFPCQRLWVCALGSWKLLVSAGLSFAATGSAHDLFTAYIQHRVAITVGAKHVDVTLQLTFFEDSSEHEREHLDTNGDGRVSRAEVEASLREAGPKFAQAVKLRVAGKPVDLTPLFAPELDLLGNDRVGRGHHCLTLHFFAPTPADLAAGTELVVEDRLWPGARALGAVQAKGKDGCRLEAVSRSDPAFPPAREGEAREFKAQIVIPPQAQSAPGTSSSHH